MTIALEKIVPNYSKVRVLLMIAMLFSAAFAAVASATLKIEPEEINDLWGTGDGQLIVTDKQEGIIVGKHRRYNLMYGDVKIPLPDVVVLERQLFK